MLIFYLLFLQEYFAPFIVHSEGKLLYFIFLSFITLPLHQDIFLSYPRYREHVFQQSLLLLHSLQFSLQLLLRRITLPLSLQYLRSEILRIIFCCFPHDAHTSFPPYSSASPPRQRLCPLSVHFNLNWTAYNDFPFCSACWLPFV